MTDMIVPSFDDETPTGRKLAIICSKGNLDMAYPGLILANAALGEGIEVHLFFTFWGFDIINKATMGDLQFSFVGNTAMHHLALGLPAQGLGAAPYAPAAAEAVTVRGADLGLDMNPEGGVHFPPPIAGFVGSDALAVIAAAEADGRLRPGGTVVEYTGGSTGTSLSAALRSIQRRARS